MKRASWAVLGCLLLIGAAAAAQETTPADQAPAQGSTTEAAKPEVKKPVPEEYGEQEFSPALRALRRGEIVMLGSLPFSLFFTLEAYDLYRYASHDFQPAYSPWPFRRPGAAPYTRQESVGVFVSALGVSLLVAVTDYLIGRIREQRAKGSPRPD